MSSPRKRADRNPDPHDPGHPVHARRGARLHPGLLDRFRELPGIEVVGAISNLHLNPLRPPELERLQRRRVRAGGGTRRLHRGAGRGRSGLLRGGGHRDPPRPQPFHDGDRPNTQPVAIIREAMARRFWTDGDAVGRLVRQRERGCSRARRRRGRRRQGEDGRRGAAQHGLRPVLAALHAVADRPGDDVDGPGTDGADAHDRRPRCRSRPVGSSRPRRWTATSR